MTVGFVFLLLLRVPREMGILHSLLLGGLRLCLQLAECPPCQCGKVASSRELQRQIKSLEPTKSWEVHRNELNVRWSLLERREGESNAAQRFYCLVLAVGLFKATFVNKTKMTNSLQGSRTLFIERKRNSAQ